MITTNSINMNKKEIEVSKLQITKTKNKSVSSKIILKYETPITILEPSDLDLEPSDLENI